MKEQRDKTAAALNALGASFCTLAEKRAFFFQIRDQLLSLYPWSFAMRQVVLDTPVPDAPVADYTNAFALPSDCLRAWSVNGAKYRIMNDEDVTARISGGGDA